MMTFKDWYNKHNSKDRVIIREELMVIADISYGSLSGYIAGRRPTPKAIRHVINEYAGVELEYPVTNPEYEPQKPTLKRRIKNGTNHP